MSKPWLLKGVALCYLAFSVPLALADSAVNPVSSTLSVPSSSALPSKPSPTSKSSPVPKSSSSGALANDDWEGFNRAMFSFNKTLDTWLVKPVAQSYQWITPQPVDDSITHFFSNLTSLLTIGNDVLQLKLGDALNDSARFVINSSLGFFGVFDVAASMGLAPHREDLGQTLAVWGVPSGPYVVWPILGPNTLRSSAGLALESVSGLHLRGYLAEETWQSWALLALDKVDVRADLLVAENMMYGDEYSFIRVIYLQQRALAIGDGAVDEGFDSEFESDGF